MKRSANSDQFAHSFTDLMTSLMVIFILLLVVFMNNRAAVNEAITDELLKQLRSQMSKGIVFEKKDRYTIAMTISDDLLNFETARFEIKPEGQQFLAQATPPMAKILCDGAYHESVENIIVEGHSDSTPYRGSSIEDSQNRNLKLSQDRSMEVVGKMLTILTGQPKERGCFLEKLSATGRGEQDLENTADQSRRVVFKIRVSASSTDIIKKLKASIK